MEEIHFRAHLIGGLSNHGLSGDRIHTSRVKSGFGDSLEEEMTFSPVTGRYYWIIVHSPNTGDDITLSGNDRDYVSADAAMRWASRYKSGF